MPLLTLLPVILNTAQTHKDLVFAILFAKVMPKVLNTMSSNKLIHFVLRFELRIVINFSAINKKKLLDLWRLHANFFLAYSLADIQIVTVSSFTAGSGLPTSPHIVLKNTTSRLRNRITRPQSTR